MLIIHTLDTSFWRQRPHRTQFHNYQAMTLDLMTFSCLIMDAFYALHICRINSNYGAADCIKQLFDCRVTSLIRIITSCVIDYLGICESCLKYFYEWITYIDWFYDWCLINVKNCDIQKQRFRHLLLKCVLAWLWYWSWEGMASYELSKISNTELHPKLQSPSVWH